MSGSKDHRRSSSGSRKPPGSGTNSGVPNFKTQSPQQDPKKLSKSRSRLGKSAQCAIIEQPPAIIPSHLNMLSDVAESANKIQIPAMVGSSEVQASISACICECEICRERFLDTNTFALHVEIVHGPRNITCRTCEQKFANRNDRGRHSCERQGAHRLQKFRVISCTICNAQFEKDPDIRRHIAKRHPKFHSSDRNARGHGSREHTCSICEQKFAKGRDLDIHSCVTERRRRPKKLLCTICEGEFNSQNQLRDHIAKVHLDVCKYCKEEFYVSEVLEKHITKLHPSRVHGIHGTSAGDSDLPRPDWCGRPGSFSCQRCTAVTFWSTAQMERHEYFSHYHSIFEDLQELDQGQLRCPRCGDLHDNERSLKIHKAGCVRSSQRRRGGN